ncbi:ribosome recycling factor, partial [bacterium]|nr:ribosome recycling factor [bacterium]
MTIQEILDDAFERMDRSNEHTKDELHKVRTGKASPAMLDSVKIDYYGTLSPLSQVATINVPEPRLITVKPWDRSMVNVVDNAIRNSNLGFNPSNDGTL